MIKAVLFDMDGVLIDSHDAWYYVFNEAFKKFENKSVTVEEFDAHMWAKAFDKVAKKYFSVPIEEVRDYYLSLYPEYQKRLSIMDNVGETLKKLKADGLKLAVVSNTQKNIVKKILNNVGLAKYFDIFMGGDDVENGKPEPDILYKTLDELKLGKEDVVFIGDSIFDKLAAEKASVKFIGFKIDGDERIDDFNELSGLI
ncbi:MAG: HAD family hydrolase [Nanoarchaeota archaeon]